MSVNNTAVALPEKQPRRRAPRRSLRTAPAEAVSSVPIMLVPLRSPEELGRGSDDESPQPSHYPRASGSSGTARVTIRILGLSLLTAGTAVLVAVAVVRP